MAMLNEDVLELCERILKRVRLLPERAEEFGSSVEKKVMSIQEFIWDNGRHTDAQLQALKNMRDGVEKWLEH